MTDFVITNLTRDDNIFDDDGIECHMKNTYFCFEIVDICEYYGINPENIFTNKD